MADITITVSSFVQVILQCLSALRMHLNLSIRVRELKEVSKSDRQQKEVEHK